MKLQLARIGKLKSFSLYFIASIVTAIIGLLVNPLMAIGLNHSDYAIIGYYSAYGSLLTPIISFSLQSYYARNYHLLDSINRKKLYNCLISVFLTLSVAAFVLFFGGYYVYHIKFVNSIPFTPYAILSFLPLFFSSFYNLYLLDLRMEDKARKYSVITVLNSLLGALLSILLVYVLRYGATGRLVALLIISVLFSLYSNAAKKVKFQWDWRMIKPALKFCFPIMLSGVLSFFFIGIDRPMLAKLDDNYMLGLYNVGIQISSYLAIFGTVLLQTFDPDLYKYTSLGQHRKVLLLVIGITVACALPNMLFMTMSKPLIGLLTAGRYVESSSFANILCIKNITTTFAYIMSGVLIGYGYSGYELINRVLGAICAFVIYQALISNFGFYGAAWGQGVTWLAMGLISCCCLMIIRKRKNETEA